jgi:azurin
MLSTLLPIVLAAPLVFSPASATQATKAPDAAKKAAAPAAKGAGRTIEITAGDDMKFNVTTITAKPGEAIRLVLKNVGKMPKAVMGHNFVLLKATAKPTDFATAAMGAPTTDYVPAANKGDVIAHTTMTGPGDTVEVTFKAPAAGSYTFLCSFPGHFAAGMTGKLEVK